jgi:prophage maintenance system killer protein
VDEAIRIHAYVLDIDQADAQEHIRDVGLLESAILRPQNLYQYQQSTEVAALAATLDWIRHNLEPLQ